MKLIAIYRCFCDETRLRILHLLSRATALCVSDLQRALRAPQVKISKHLAYMKEHEFVESERAGNRVYYRLPDRKPRELQRHLRCLQDCVAENSVFRRDLQRLKARRSSASNRASDPCPFAAR